MRADAAQPMHLVESAADGCTLQSSLGAEIYKQLQLLFATTLTLTLRHSDVIVVVKLILNFAKKL